VDFRYAAYDPEQESLAQLIERLHKLFNELLLLTSGDVDEAFDWLERIATRHGLFGEHLTPAQFRKLLEEQEAIRATPQGWKMTGKTERAIRQSSLDAIFGKLQRDPAGDHRSNTAGQGLERLPETRPFVFGDPVGMIDSNATIKNAMKRCGVGPLSLQEDDLEVYETEQLSSCATVLLLDISHSMILYGEDRITPAKKVALALVELIKTRYPKDSLQVVTFGDEAREVPLDSLPYIRVGPFHTNTRDALIMARELLRKSKQANRQIFMITDGKPSALTERNGEIYKNPFGLDQRVVSKTLDEASACRRYGIPITTFMLTRDPVLVGFVEQFTELNRGRAFYAGLDRLGAFLLVDFVRNRRRMVR
jgi:Ca-activated chloride channel family protein